MIYVTARSRLRQALVEVAAGRAAPGIIKRVFELQSDYYLWINS
jgi:hypothetical protein